MDSAVFEIQTYIRNISRYDNDIPSLIPDGIFGNETTESITAFQRKHLLEQTGKVNFTTWNKLFEENSKALYSFSPPVQTAPATNSDFPLKQGNTSHLNKNVNLMLLRLSDFYRNFDGAEMSDEYTEKTKELIKIFQKLTGNTVTGETDKATWNLLSYLYLLLTEDKEH